jgi:hypothetical protein
MSIDQVVLNGLRGKSNTHLNIRRLAALPGQQPAVPASTSTDKLQEIHDAAKAMADGMAASFPYSAAALNRYLDGNSPDWHFPEERLLQSWLVSKAVSTLKYRVGEEVGKAISVLSPSTPVINITTVSDNGDKRVTDGKPFESFFDLSVPMGDGMDLYGVWGSSSVYCSPQIQVSLSGKAISLSGNVEFIARDKYNFDTKKRSFVENYSRSLPSNWMGRIYGSRAVTLWELESLERSGMAKSYDVWCRWQNKVSLTSGPTGPLSLLHSWSWVTGKYIEWR